MERLWSPAVATGGNPWQAEAEHLAGEAIRLAGATDFQPRSSRRSSTMTAREHGDGGADAHRSATYKRSQRHKRTTPRERNPHGFRDGALLEPEVLSHRSPPVERMLGASSMPPRTTNPAERGLCDSLFCGAFPFLSPEPCVTGASQGRHRRRVCGPRQNVGLTLRELPRHRPSPASRGDRPIRVRCRASGGRLRSADRPCCVRMRDGLRSSERR